MRAALLVKLLIVSLSFVESANNVVGGKLYLMKLVDRMMELLTMETQISGDGLPMLDMTGKFTELKSYDITMDGDVKFHSGFVMTIKTIDVPDLKYADQTDSSKAFVKTSLFMNDVNVTYELDIDFEEFKGRASMIIWMPGLEFTVSVAKDHETDEITPLVTFTNFAGAVTKVSIFNYPSNPYTQLISKEVKSASSSTTLMNQLKESFIQWRNLQKFFEQAVEEIAFPEICYTCY